MRLLELGVQALGQTRMRPQQSTPGAQLPQRESVLLGRGDLDGGHG